LPEPSLSDYKKSQILSGFLHFQKKPKVLKKPEFQNLASKKPNWQPCSIVNSISATSYYYDATITFFLIAQQ